MLIMMMITVFIMIKSTEKIVIIIKNSKMEKDLKKRQGTKAESLARMSLPIFSVSASF